MEGGSSAKPGELGGEVADKASASGSIIIIIIIISCISIIISSSSSSSIVIIIIIITITITISLLVCLLLLLLVILLLLSLVLLLLLVSLLLLLLFIDTSIVMFTCTIAGRRGRGQGAPRRAGRSCGTRQRSVWHTRRGLTLQAHHTYGDLATISPTISSNNNLILSNNFILPEG